MIYSHVYVKKEIPWLCAFTEKVNVSKEFKEFLENFLFISLM